MGLPVLMLVAVAAVQIGLARTAALTPWKARHVVVMLFCVTTYALAPVAGFGWLLTAMGLAQCRKDQPALRAAYVGVFFVVLLYAEIPWAGVLLNWTS